MDDLELDPQVDANVEPQGEPKTKGQQNYEKDLLKFKQQARSEAQRARELEEKLAGFERTQLESQNRYKELYESADKKAKEWEQENKKLKQDFVGGLKKSTLKEVALKKGWRDEALDDLELYDSSSVVEEYTTLGNVNFLGAEEFIDKLLTSKPYLRKTLTPPIINNGNPDGNLGKELSVTDILKLQKTDPKKYQEIMNKKYGIGKN